MKIYISGPMSNLPEYNRPAFHAAAQKLRTKGHEVLNPAEVDLGPDAEWLDYIRVDIKMLMDADAIYMLEGWETSRGATLEKHIADSVGIPTLHITL